MVSVDASALVVSATMDAGGFDVDGELARLFGDGVRPLHLEQALFDAVLAGWVRRQRARLLFERMRAYQIAIGLFCEYLLDRRYLWVAICTGRLGAVPQQIVDARTGQLLRPAARTRPSCALRERLLHLTRSGS